MNVKPIKRNLKNVVYNYTDAQVKVREATSNDPWGPTSSLMAEIADMTNNQNSFSEIMQMIWRRLNDNGKNWRHVYKALILLDYIIKTGTDYVAQHCRENIYVIQTLRDFQYVDKEVGKDHGANVREKAKALCVLLTDEEKLKTERAKALKTRERFQWQKGFISNKHGGSSEGFGSTDHDAGSSGGRRNSYSAGASTAAPKDLTTARPRTAEEEEIQLQLALAMSREQADQEEKSRKNDEMRLRMALSESSETKGSTKEPKGNSSNQDNLLGLFDSPAAGNTAVSDPWAPTAAVKPAAAFAVPPASSTMPFIPPPNGQTNVTAPKKTNYNNPPALSDPWAASDSSNANADLSDLTNAFNISNSATDNSSVDQTWPSLNNGNSLNKPAMPLTPNSTGGSLNYTSVGNGQGISPGKGDKKVEEKFLGNHSSLVDLDSLMASKPAQSFPAAKAANPAPHRTATAPQIAASNPFNSVAPRSINDLRSANQQPAWGASPQQAFGQSGMAPLQPTSAQSTNYNPFL